MMTAIKMFWLLAFKSNLILKTSLLKKRPRRATPKVKTGSFNKQHVSNSGSIVCWNTSESLKKFRVIHAHAPGIEKLRDQFVA